ncbi:MAG: hypothetical protein ACF8XB_09085 [Planctomycetota bacterium JB042]
MTVLTESEVEVLREQHSRTHQGVKVRGCPECFPTPSSLPDGLKPPPKKPRKPSLSKNVFEGLVLLRGLVRKEDLLELSPEECERFDFATRWLGETARYRQALAEQRRAKRGDDR